MKTLITYLPQFVTALRAQLREDEKRWGDTWIKRGRPGQEARFVVWVREKYDTWLALNDPEAPFPWLKVAGEALIGWVREKCLGP